MLSGLCTALKSVLRNVAYGEEPSSVSGAQPEPSASSQGTKIIELRSIDLFAFICVRTKLYVIFHLQSLTCGSCWTGTLTKREHSKWHCWCQSGSAALSVSPSTSQGPLVYWTSPVPKPVPPGKQVPDDTSILCAPRKGGEIVSKKRNLLMWRKLFINKNP